MSDEMKEVKKSLLNDIQVSIFEKISKNELGELKNLLIGYKETVDFFDVNGMSPLQHACYKGNKDSVQLFLDLGADVNSSQHEYNYTALHFAALSGNAEICFMLLLAGAKPHATNTVGRTAAQMAAFVSNHQAVATINNFIPKCDVEYYSKLQGQQTESYLPIILLEPFHKFIIQINLHPVRVALNLQKYGLINSTENLKKTKKVLDLMTEREFKRRNETNEIMAFKFHYLGWIVSEVIKCKEYFQARKDKDSDKAKMDFVELFAKRVLKEGKNGQLDYVESTIRDCVREFPFRECTIFRQVVTQLAHKECGAALEVIKSAINGQRGFQDVISYCSSCGEEKPDKKCSKCKEVQYCDRECQRLHWFMHKKACSRAQTSTTQPTAGNAVVAASSQNAKKEIDTIELSESLQNLIAG